MQGSGLNPKVSHPRYTARGTIRHILNPRKISPKALAKVKNSSIETRENGRGPATTTSLAPGLGTAFSRWCSARGEASLRGISRRSGRSRTSRQRLATSAKSCPIYARVDGPGVVAECAVLGHREGEEGYLCDHGRGPEARDPSQRRGKEPDGLCSVRTRATHSSTHFFSL